MCVRPGVSTNSGWALTGAWEVNECPFPKSKVEVAKTCIPPFSNPAVMTKHSLASPTLVAEAHATMSLVIWLDGSWPDVERSLRRAIELNPDYATAHHWYSHLLIGLGRVEEAVEEIQLAQALDPLSPVIAQNVGSKLFLARRYPAALEAYRRALELDPDQLWTLAGMAKVYAQLGRWEEAREKLRAAREGAGPERGTLRARLAAVEAGAGRRDRALASLREAESEDVNPFEMAIAYIAIGDVDRAFDLLERAEWKYPVRAVRADPRLDPVRHDPRFIRLSSDIDRRMGVR